MGSQTFFLWCERLLPTIPVRAKITRMNVRLYMHDALCDTVVKSSSHPTRMVWLFQRPDWILACIASLTMLIDEILGDLRCDPGE